MLKETDIPNLYIICDTTDMRKGLKGLLEIVTAKYKLDPYSDSLFLFYRIAEGNKDHKCKIRPVLKFPTIKC